MLLRRKLDPRLATLVSLGEHKLAALQRAEATLLADLAAGPKDGSPPHAGEALGNSTLHGLDTSCEPYVVSVLIRFREGVPHYERDGVVLGPIAGGVATARVSLDTLPDLEADPRIRYIELSRPLSRQGGHGDSGAQTIGAHRLHEQRHDLRGQGVVVGIIDYAIDFYHEDLRDPSGKSRIEHLWVQRPEPGTALAAGQVPKEFDYGVEYTAAEIDKDIQSGTPYRTVNHPPTSGAPPEVDGHGTHAAGIAAGNGHHDADYCGVAPEAAIIFVATVASGPAPFGGMKELLDAIDYIFLRAGDRPCVINISMGDNLGPHDGNSLAERHIDAALTKPGRAVVVSAGNCGDKGKHASGLLRPRRPSRLALEVPRGQIWEEAVQIWYPEQNQLCVRVIAPHHQISKRIWPDDRKVFPLADTCVSISSILREESTGMNLIYIQLIPRTGRTIPEGKWVIELSARPDRTAPAGGRWHAWIDSQVSRVKWLNQIDSSMTIMTPGNGKRVITVGNHTTFMGATHVVPTSSRGPTMDDRRKPDLVAPGIDIGAPMAHDRSALTGDHVEHYVARVGTSVAAPHVTGAVALMFQVNKSLRAEDAARILKKLAVRGPAGEPDNEYGWGRLHLANLCSSHSASAVSAGAGIIESSSQRKESIHEGSHQARDRTGQHHHNRAAEPDARR